MKNIYAVRDYDDPNIKRNMFDFDHRENLTLDWGKIYPLGQPIEVVPGDNVHLKLSAGIHAMPLMFPVQTPMQFKVFAFYVPYRLLWKNFEDYITGVYDEYSKKPTHPWHQITTQSLFDKLLTTGSLGDYLGIPTTLYEGANGVQTVPVLPALTLDARNILYSESVGEHTGKAVVDPNDPTTTNIIMNVDPATIHRSFPRPVYLKSDVDFTQTPADILSHTFAERLVSLTNFPQTAGFKAHVFGYYVDFDAPVSIPADDKLILSFSGSYTDSFSGTDTFDNLKCKVLYLESATGENGYHVVNVPEPSECELTYTDGNFLLTVSNANYLMREINACLGSNHKARLFFGAEFYSNTWSSPFCEAYQQYPQRYLGARMSYSSYISVAQDTDLQSSPFVGSNPRIALNALPARAYEAICRSYFRNDKVNPILDNNNPPEPIYNDYNTTHEDGADTTEYDFEFANWELDQFTDSVPTPQFGAAPLIGVTILDGHTARLDFEATNTTGTAAATQNGTLSAKIELSDDDNLTMTGITSYDSGLPDANLKRLMQQINFGVSINDIRNVNALQRFKERMQLRSYRYKDQIMNHFGVDVSNVELDMPEYIGGYNFDIQVNKVNNTSAPAPEVPDGAPLGDYAAQASIFGKMERQISKFCPEHGLIMCVGYIVPRPCYAQALPRLFTKVTDKFNYYFPEFGKMGYVPVPNAELAPLQYHTYDLVHGTDTVHGTFGYQRAWYEYMSMIDGAHGAFRTNLADYLAMRVFSQPPQLNGDFITVHPDQVNNIFAVDSDHKFMGFVDYDCKIERPIPRFGMPTLE